MSEARLFAATAFTEIYERELVGPLFRPFAEKLLDRLTPAREDSVIDVACGTGIVARLTRQRLGPGARIVGVDVAPAMLGVAQSVDATIDWRQGSAASLPVETSERFTLLTCHQGFQFMPDKPAVLREMRRVLAPGGRVVIVVPNRRGVWARFEHTPFGTGRPFSRSQLSELLRETNFTPAAWSEALLFPPSKRRWMMRFHQLLERSGRRFWPMFAGVLIVEAQKRLYQGIPVTARASQCAT